MNNDDRCNNEIQNNAHKKKRKKLLIYTINLLI